MTPNEERAGKLAIEYVPSVNLTTEDRIKLEKLALAALNAATDQPDERWVTQQLVASNDFCSALQKENAKLREDKERLDWLDDKRLVHFAWVWDFIDNFAEANGYNITVREAIDEQMKSDLCKPRMITPPQP